MVDVDDYSKALADGIEAALPTWVVHSVVGVMTAWAGGVEPDVMLAAEEAATRAGSDIGSAVRALLSADIDDQRTTPLAIVRTAVRYPTEVLVAAGVSEIQRDEFAEAAFPDDVYDLSPASFADIAPALADVGIAWGAWKAMEHRRRHGGAPAGN